MNKIQEFLRSVTVLDTETTGVDFKTDEIVEVAGGGLGESGKWEVESLLMGSTIPVPAEASAVNNISNKMIAGLPIFSENLDKINDVLSLSDATYMVAHNSNFDRRILVSSYERAKSSDFDKFNKQEDWICTWKLSKQLYPSDGKMKYGLAFLRYFLDLDISEDMLAHRAGADVSMCGILLEYLIDVAVEQGKLDPTQDIGPQLQRLCWKPLDINIWPLGKHKGVKIVDVPTEYLLWCVDKIDLLDHTHTKYDKDLTKTVEKVLESRL